MSYHLDDFEGPCKRGIELAGGSGGAPAPFDDEHLVTRTEVRLTTLLIRVPDHRFMRSCHIVPCPLESGVNSPWQYQRLLADHSHSSKTFCQ
jgi:hypothetical protein